MGACVTTVGLCLPQLGGAVTRNAFEHYCKRAEELGFAHLWVQDHLFFPHEPVSGYAAREGVPVPQRYRSTMAPLETLAMAAAWTERVVIGTSVLVAGYHRPVELAQRLATIDLLSEGRLVVGFSVGWSDDEHLQMDVDPRTRGARCDELIDALEACWGADPVEHHGRFFDIPRSDVQPKPLQRPRPRLLSGMRSAAGLRRTVERFDIWNPASGDLDTLLATHADLNAHRSDGQPPLELYLRTFVEPPIVAPGLNDRGVEGLLEEVDNASAAGADAVIVDPNFWSAIDSPEAWKTVPDRLAELVEIAEVPGGAGR
jgi:probable F420-dependent oxidoreductase